MQIGNFCKLSIAGECFSEKFVAFEEGKMRDR